MFWPYHVTFFSWILSNQLWHAIKLSYDNWPSMFSSAWSHVCNSTNPKIPFLLSKEPLTLYHKASLMQHLNQFSSLWYSQNVDHYLTISVIYFDFIARINWMTQNIHCHIINLVTAFFYLKLFSHTYCISSYQVAIWNINNYLSFTLYIVNCPTNFKSQHW